MAKIKTHALGHLCLLHVYYNITMFWCSFEIGELACNKEKCLQITNLNLTTMILSQARSVHRQNHNLLEQTGHQENVKITGSPTTTTTLTIRPVHFHVILVEATWSHCKLTPDL